MSDFKTRLTRSDVECCAFAPRCHCLFELWKRGEPIAACPTLEAHDAARRLLGEKP